MKKLSLLCIIFTLLTIFITGQLIAKPSKVLKDKKIETKVNRPKKKAIPWYIRAKKRRYYRKNYIYASLKWLLPKFKKKKKVRSRSGLSGDITSDADVSAFKRSAEMNNVLVLLSEIPRDNKDPIIAPVFVSAYKNIFNTRTDFSFSWVGFKLTLKFKQKKFPWKNTSLQQILIGSFVHASGTNLGFVENKFAQENRFYTNYTSQILVFNWHMFKYLTTGVGLGSRQYFFFRNDPPENFKMPKDHVNIFPRGVINIGYITEKGIDQLAKGMQVSSWYGYGIRNKWDEWGEPDNLQSSTQARTFSIYAVLFKIGILINNNQNFILKGKYKGGVDNDFLSRPRFGASIDNANLDVVHGFTLDEFRVYRFGLINFQYGINVFSWLRFRLFADYGHIFSPNDEERDLFGAGYGFRIITIGGLPIWFSHGFGRENKITSKEIRQTMMVMTAAGW